MKKRRWAALVLCLLLVFQTAALPADAAESVYFVAAGNEVLPLSDDTMPFWSGGYLYIAASTFSGTSRKALGVSYMGSGQTAVLYNNSGDRSLIFDLDKDYTQDREGNISYPGALRRGGVVFVPAYLVARYFNLLYSVLDVENGYLVWIRQPSFNMTDKQFANAAEYPCAISYAEYIKKKKTSSGTSAVEDPTGTEIDGKSVYLCLEAGDGTEALLDALDDYEAQAPFFCTPEFGEPGRSAAPDDRHGKQHRYSGGCRGRNAHSGGTAGRRKPCAGAGHLRRHAAGHGPQWERRGPSGGPGGGVPLRAAVAGPVGL